MGIFAELLFSFIRRGPKDTMDRRFEYIFYKIVDCIGKTEYLLQCINTKATFQSSLTEIVFDMGILQSLHPFQSCYVGIEYAKLLTQSSLLTEKKIPQRLTKTKYPSSRYGQYFIGYQNRKGEICFINKNTKEEVLMDPRDIALSEELIQEFDAVHSFYIGLLAGLKLHNPIKKKSEKAISHRHPNLRLVKS